VSRNVVTLAVLILALAPRASAQVAAGEASMNLNANVSAGYGDDYSNVGGSDHSIFGAGNADFSGWYYNPNFLFFDVQPYYNQSRLNSTFQSMTAASGVSASARIFSGSAFPGSISYSDNYNTSGNFGIPGLANLTTHGDNDSLAINWGVRLQNLPTLHLSFSDSNSTYSVYGANTPGTSHEETFSATSAYRIAGFRLNGGYQYIGTKTDNPEFLSEESSQQTDSGANAFFFGVAHNLPWNGSISASATRVDISTGFGAATSTDKYDTAADSISGGLSFGPLPHLNIGANTYYTDNLAGTLYNTLLTSGVTEPLNEGQPPSHDLTLTGYGNYEIPVQHLNLNAFVDHQQQTFMGASFADDSYNGTASYSNWLLGGSLSGVLGVTRTSVETSHQSLVGLNTSLNYSHAIRRWSVAGGFSYSQDTQTVLINYTTSGYSYNGSIGRRIGRRSHWGAYASGSRSLLTGEPGTATSSQSYTTTLSLPRLSLSASYSDSSGNALLTPTGLVATPIPLPAVNPAAVVLYNGRGYSLGFGSTPVRGLTLSAAYADARSATNSNSTLSNNNNENMYFLLNYRFRKLSFDAGYSRFLQGFSVSGNPPTMVGSMYVGISRWFNFF
jgi:hypothetical protein